ncbi:MAG: T9SS type A sorting domain-containing protein, partial [Ignavibacteria bacterium]
GTAGAIFCEGLLWGGKVFDKNPVLIRASGSEYGSGNVPISRLFRVMPFYKESDLTNDASNFFNVPERLVADSMINQLYNQYEKDWNEWPAERGAPFYDINKNGKYEPDMDIPGIAGASQTIWINYNDALSSTFYQSPSIGLEIQETYWAYADNDAAGIYRGLRSAIFKHARMIYKGNEFSTPGSHIDSMYIVQWVEQDLGTFSDDLLGCDTSLNMGYVYNSKNEDPVYSAFLEAPPAVGHVLLQGPAYQASNPQDSAIINFEWRNGFKYFNAKPLTVFIAFKIGDNWGPPRYNYNGALEFYSMMRGYFPYPYPGSEITYNQFGVEFGGYGTYMNSGDPVTGTGWIDGITDIPGNRYSYMVSGPINLELGDTAEIVIATVGGLGTDRLNSITELRQRAREATYLYQIFVNQMTDDNLNPQLPEREIPEREYALYQNYPNPFNSSTIIKYELPEPAFVKLIVYDILGSTVKVLVNENKAAGTYQVEFNPSDLASGIYICRISFDNTSSKLVKDGLTKTNKLVHIK